MYKLLNRNFPGPNYPILIIHILYLFVAVAMSFEYFHKIMEPVDFYTDEYGGIFRVLNLDAVSTIQFRFLVPLMVGLVTYTTHLPPKAVMMFYTVVFLYLTFIAYFKILCVYYKNSLVNSLLAILIVYPLSWNLIAVNKIFFFTDTSAVFFMTICIYFILSRKFLFLIAFFFLGTVNHYSIGFIIPAFLLFNYRSIFTTRVVKQTSVLVLLFAGYFIISKMLLPELPSERDDGFFIANFGRTVQHLRMSPVHLLLRDIFFNFGGIHIFAFLFYFSPMWKKIKREYTIYNLTILIFVLMTLTGFGLFSEELRCYVPILPFLMIPAMMFFSQFSKELMPLRKEMIAEKKEKVFGHAIPILHA